MRVREKMRRGVMTVAPEESVRSAWQLLREGRIRHLPVVEKGRLVGIVTDRDLRMALPSPVQPGAVEELLQRLEQLRVEDIMTREVITVTPETSIEDAAWLLLSRRIGGLPVLEGEELVGILTETDLLEAFVEMLGIWSTGSRIELVVEEKPGAFTTVSQIVQERGGEVLGAVAARMLDQRKWALLIRVRTPELDDLLKALEEAGHPVLSAA